MRRSSTVKTHGAHPEVVEPEIRCSREKPEAGAAEFGLNASERRVTLASEDGRQLREFTLGILVLYGVGQLTYAIVPASGPHASIAAFEHPLDGAVFWPLVDVVAGTLLSVTTWLAVPRVVAWESARRHRAGLPPVFAGAPVCSRHTVRGRT